MPNNLTISMMDNDEASILQHLTSDYIQMLLYGIFAIIGLPVNISTLIYMLRRYRHAKSFLLLLHINLNISDILVLGVYVPGTIGWLVSLEWKAGAYFCKIMRYIDASIFAISSNIMVCIALYRLSALRYPLWVNAVGHSRVPRMLIVAWTLAMITMIPQLFVWRQVNFPHITQCVTVWTEIMAENQTLTDSQLHSMKLYSIQNAFIIFYIPLFILVICYVLILKDIYKTLNTDTECSSGAAYISEMSRNSSSKTNNTNNNQFNKSTKKDLEITLTTRTVRGQEKFRRAKVRSLRITLLLILTYVVTWLPYNLLAWWLVYDFASYKVSIDSTYIWNSLVVLNSVINPFIYGRCQGVRLLFKCRNRLTNRASNSKKLCKLLGK